MALPTLWGRKREKENVVDTSWTQKNFKNGQLISQVVYPSPGIFDRSTMWDFNNKNWRSTRGLIMSPMSLVKESRTSAGEMSLTLGRWTGSDSYRTEMVGDFASSGFESSIRSLFTDADLTNDLARMNEVAYAKTVAKVNTSPLCTGEFLNDLGKTVEMLKRPFGTSARLISKIALTRAKHLKKSGVNVAEATANAWLENNYGVQPILLDIGNIIEEVGAFSARNWVGFRVARTEERLERSSSKEFSFGQATDPKWVRTGTATCSHTVRTCGGMIYSVEPSTNLEDVVRILGLRPMDVPATIYEIIPLSFVLDWFTNVGTWLSAVTPNPGITRQRAWVTTISERTISVDRCVFSYSELQSANPNVYVTASAGMNLPTWKRMEVSRDADPSIGLTPVFTGKPLSIPHSISAASLTCQQLVRSFGKFAR